MVSGRLRHVLVVWRISWSSELSMAKLNDYRLVRSLATTRHSPARQLWKLLDGRRLLGAEVADAAARNSLVECAPADRIRLVDLLNALRHSQKLRVRRADKRRQRAPVGDQSKIRLCGE